MVRCGRRFHYITFFRTTIADPSKPHLSLDYLFAGVPLDAVLYNLANKGWLWLVGLAACQIQMDSVARVILYQRSTDLRFAVMEDLCHPSLYFYCCSK